MDLDESPITGTPSWEQLPTDVLTAVIRHLPQTDQGAARLACKAWAEHILEIATNVVVNYPLSAVNSEWLARRLPNLVSLRLMQARSLYHVHTLTQLTSLEVIEQYIPDLEPLSNLPGLRQLTLDGCDLGHAPFFGCLSHLRSLAVLGCQQGSREQVNKSLSELLPSRLRQFRLINSSVQRELTPVTDLAHQLHTLCISAWNQHDLDGLTALHSLQVLAVTRATNLFLDPIFHLTGLQALSLAGLQPHTNSNASQNFARFSKMSRLRVLDLRDACRFSWEHIKRISSLRIVSVSTDINLPDDSQLWLHVLRQTDLVSDAASKGLPVLASNWERLKGLVLRRKHEAGRERGYTAASEGMDMQNMEVFDGFWLAQVRHSAFVNGNEFGEDDDDYWGPYYDDAWEEQEMAYLPDEMDGNDAFDDQYDAFLSDEINYEELIPDEELL